MVGPKFRWGIYRLFVQLVSSLSMLSDEMKGGLQRVFWLAAKVELAYPQADSLLIAVISVW